MERRGDDLEGMQQRLERLEARQSKLRTDAKKLADRREVLEVEIRTRQSHREVQDDFDERMLLGGLMQQSGLIDHFRLSSDGSSGNQKTTIDAAAVSGALRLLNEHLRDVQKATPEEREESQGVTQTNQGEM